MTSAAEWTDAEMLAALWAMDVQGHSATAVARDLGRSRSAVLGMRKRVMDDLAESEIGSSVRNPANFDVLTPGTTGQIRRLI